MTLKKLLINLILIIGILGLISFGFFYKVLPTLTNNGQVVSVPDIKGMSLSEAVDFLKSKNLDFSVSDTAYNLNKEPLTILEQYPRPNSKVKINRKINLVINAINPPAVEFPDLTGFGFDFAQKQLKTLDLKLGTIQYKPDIAHNAVLESRINGAIILPGQKIQKGSTIDLVIGSPNDKFPIPDFTDMQFDEVEVFLAGLNLKIKELHNVENIDKPTNAVQRQFPQAGDTIRLGDTVELWIYNRQ